MKKWSNEEDSYLIENYATMDKSELSKQLDRSWTGIVVRIERLKKTGISVPGKRSSDWSDIEDQYLIDNYHSKDRQIIEQELDRTWTAIHGRAFKLKLSRPNRFPTNPQNLEKVEKKIILEKDYLIRRYCVEVATLDEIGLENSVSGKTVMRRLSEYGVIRRRSGPGPNYETKKMLVSKEELEEYYINQKLTFSQIGQKLGFSGVSVAKRAKEFGIVANSAWKGYGDIGGWYWGQVLENARRRNIEVSVTIEEAWELFVQQNRKCALSGLDLGFSDWRHRNETTASFDRINSLLPYMSGNVQWIHKKIQPMKWGMDNDEFIAYCTIITAHYREANIQSHEKLPCYETQPVNTEY
jgi:hypothetical protein